MVLMLIPKYLILQMSLPKNNIYNFTIALIMHSIFTFSLINSIEEKHKVDLLYHFSQISLLLYNLKSYRLEFKKHEELPIILEIKVENSITISLLQLDLDVCATVSFCAMLIDPFVFYFTSSLDFSNINYI